MWGKSRNAIRNAFTFFYMKNDYKWCLIEVFFTMNNWLDLFVTFDLFIKFDLFVTFDLFTKSYKL